MPMRSPPRTSSRGSRAIATDWPASPAPAKARADGLAVPVDEDAFAMIMAMARSLNDVPPMPEPDALAWSRADWEHRRQTKFGATRRRRAPGLAYQDTPLIVLDDDDDAGPLSQPWRPKEWTLRPLFTGAASPPPPQCTVNSSATTTAFVLSTGGFTGNLFHDYTDVLIPAFITAHRFAGEVQFLVSSFKSWWTNRYLEIFQQLSKYEVIDIDNDDEVRCFQNVVVGPTFHKELGVDASKTPPPGYSMVDFRAMLRGAFGLERATAVPSGDKWDIRRRPRLLIIARRGSRAFLNERAMADMAMSLGFDVRVGEPDITSDVSKFARLVNSADVMVGVHGAGLTNMVFLPAGAVLIQVVPYGGLEWLARGTFKEPSADMQIHYMEYMIQLDETTLSEQYPKDHPVLKDPASIHKQGWDALKTVYLDKQNVKPHLGRLKITFMEALKLLPHGQQQANNN
uniref:Uncharacterized protein n=1 Tax=Avena sativa TaxID=4498 RepID=A0ACD5YRE8_AVESA